MNKKKILLDKELYRRRTTCAIITSDAQIRIEEQTIQHEFERVQPNLNELEKERYTTSNCNIYSL